LDLSPCTQKMCSLLPWYTEFPVYLIRFLTSLWTFGLKTSLFQQKHPPKFYFSGSITHKLTFKTKISKFTCILVFFRRCEQKLNFCLGFFFFKNSAANLNFHQIQKIYKILFIGAIILRIRPRPLKFQTITPPNFTAFEIHKKF
jgi:hypothetical protein